MILQTQTPITDSAQAEIVPVTVSEEMLPELPSLFGGGLAGMFSEIFQNSFRAGAARVQVRWDEHDQSIVFEDDGCGIDDAAVLLNAGKSTWDRTRVIHPAGKGVFALLDAAIVQRITIRSRDWRLEATPKCLHTRQATCYPETQVWVGTSVSLHLVEGVITATALIEKLQQARALYPFAVTLRTDEIGDTPATYIDPLAYPKELILRLAKIGDVWWAPRKYAYPHRVAIWSYAPCGEQSLGQALLKAASEHPRQRLAEAAISNGDLTWFIDPASGALPRLPDRRELMDGPALHAAAKSIVAALVDRILAEAIEASYAWSQKSGWSADFKWRFSHVTGLTEEVLAELGWTRVFFNDFGRGVYAVDEGDSWAFEVDPCYGFDRSACFVRSHSLQQTLCSQGYSVVQADDAEQPEVKINGLRMPQGEDSLCIIALAERINVAGWGELPYLLATNSGFDVNGLDAVSHKSLENVALIYAGGIGDFVRAIQTDRVLLNAIFWWVVTESNFGAGAWSAYDYLDRNEINWPAFERDLLTEVAKAFDPDWLQLQSLYYAAGDVLKHLSKAVRAIRRAHDLAEKHPTLPVSWRHLERALSLVEKPMAGVIAAQKQQAEELGLIPDPGY